MNMHDADDFENQDVQPVRPVQSNVSPVQPVPQPPQDTYTQAEAKIAEFNKKLLSGEVDVDAMGSGGLTINTDEDKNFSLVEGLPSKCLLYPEGTVITARPLKVIEVKKLATLNESSANFVINDILSSCVRGIDVNNLYLADKVYIIFWLRAMSFKDPNYVVGFTCTNCGKESSYHFQINTVSVTHLDEEFNHTLILPDKGDSLYLDFLTVKDELDVSNFSSKYQSECERLGMEIDTELVSLAFMIKSINGEPVDALTRYKYINDGVTISAQDYARLKSYVKK